MEEALFREWRSLPAMFFGQAERFGDRPMVWSKSGGDFRPLSWQAAADQAARLAAGLRNAGLQEGDRVALVSESRPEWPVADLAVMAAGCISVPAYTTNTVDDHRHILGNSGAAAVIVSTPALFRQVWPAALQVPSCRLVVWIDAQDHPHDEDIRLERWADLAATPPEPTERLADRIDGLRRSDVACLIYTSGTSGRPRGVMLTHGGILHNCEGAFDVIKALGVDDEVFLSFLPLSHAYEHTGGLFFPMTLGAQVYYSQGVDHLARELAQVRPTVMTAVPRLYEVLLQRIAKEMSRQGGLRQRLFDKAVALGRKRYERGGRLGPVDAAVDGVLDRLVRAKVQQRFGGRLKGLVSGGAPLNPDVGLFFHALGIGIYQGYGQTENSPVATVNRPGRVKMHTVGPPLKNTEVRIAEDGEILIKGELVMKGYWNDPEATENALRDGWLHTGDVGRMDEDGYLVITDRKKDIIVNSGGDNIAPAWIEGLLALEPEIGQVMVFGDRRPYLVALVVPDAEFARSWAGRHGKPDELAELGEEPDFRKAVAAAVDRVNANLSQIERVRRFALADEPFTIENNELTPTMKIRRHVILDRYGDRLNALYEMKADKQAKV
jgi:long-chain acyl-CoA synthetase